MNIQLVKVRIEMSYNVELFHFNTTRFSNV